MVLHHIESVPLGGVHGWTVASSDIEGESGQILVGKTLFENPRLERTELSWRAVWKGKPEGWNISRRDEPTEPIHDAPRIALAVLLFIERQIAEYREGNMPVPNSHVEKPSGSVVGPHRSEMPAEPPTLKEETVPRTAKRRETEAVPPSPVLKQTPEMPRVSVSTIAEKPATTTLDETAVAFTSLSERLRVVATYLADDVGAQEIADALCMSKDTLKGYFCQLRNKFSLGVPELRELFRALFKHDSSLRSPVAKKRETASSVTDFAEVAASEQFGKEILQTFSSRERAVAGLLAKGLTLSQVSSRTNLRLSDVGVCRRKLKMYFGCKDDAALLSRLKDIAEGKAVSVPAHRSSEREQSKTEHVDVSAETGTGELLKFPLLMQAVEEFRLKLSSGYELTIGDLVVRPSGDAVSVSLRIRQST